MRWPEEILDEDWKIFSQECELLGYYVCTAGGMYLIFERSGDHPPGLAAYKNGRRLSHEEVIAVAGKGSMYTPLACEICYVLRGNDKWVCSASNSKMRCWE